MTLQSNLTVSNNFTQALGTFNANGNAVTVNGATTTTGGNYISGTGTQTFNGSGLTIAGGIFTASSNSTINAASLTIASSGAGVFDAGTATNANVSVAGDVTINSGAGNLKAPNSTGTFLVGGNWSDPAGSSRPATARSRSMALPIKMSRASIRSTA